MFRRFLYSTGVVLLVLVVFAPGAGAAHPDVNTEIENLKKRIERLEEEKKPPVEKPFTLGGLEHFLSFYGLVEVDVVYGSSRQGKDESDVHLATAEFGIAAHLDEQVHAHITFLYEEPEPATVGVDEAVITLTCPRSFMGLHPLFEGGRFYLPFGRFKTVFVSDPLTLELGETNHSAVLLGLSDDRLVLNLTAFGGRVDLENAGAGIVDGGVFSLSVRPTETMELGVSYITDLAESDAELIGTGAVAGYTGEVPALAAFFSYSRWHLGLELEVVSALADFDAALVDPAGPLSGPRPSAWNAELSWFPDGVWLAAVKIDGGDDFKDNEKRYGVTGSVGVRHNTVLALEYFYSDVDRAAGDAHQLTAQLALQF